VVAAAFLAAMLETINDDIITKNSKSAEECMSCFNLDKPDEPQSSTRHATFEYITSKAETLLEWFEDQHNSSICLPGQEVIDQHNIIYDKLCKGPAHTLAKTLSRLGHRRLVIGFDECTFLNQAPKIRGETNHRHMSIIAIQRIIKAGDGFPTEDFTYWHVFLDTSSSVFDLVPTRKDAPSGRLADKLDPLPAWTFMGYDQMVPQQPSNSPKEALKISRLRQYGRPVRCHQVLV
jgi:hypothetical protein